jgi:hypothetical protein
MKIILLFAVLTLNLFSLEIKDRTNNSVVIKLDNNNKIEYKLY